MHHYHWMQLLPSMTFWMKMYALVIVWAIWLMALLVGLMHVRIILKSHLSLDVPKMLEMNICFTTATSGAS